MPAPDEELKVRISADIGGLKRGIAEATRAVQDFARASSRWQEPDSLYSMNQQLHSLYNTLAQGTKPVETMKSLVSVLSSAAQEAADTFGVNSEEAANYKDALANANQILSGLTGKEKEYTEDLKENTKAQKENAGAMNQSSGAGGKLAKTIGRMVLYRMIRSVLSAINQALKEGTQNLYAWDKAHKGVAGVVQTMDAYQSTITKLKNSVGAALYPVLASLLPLFQQICSWVIQAINYVNMFFSILAGFDTYKRATDVNDRYAKSISGVGAAAAKASKDLMGFDEINRLSSKATAGGGGGTGYAYDIGDAFEDVAIDTGFQSKVQPFIDFIKNELVPVLQSAWEVAKPCLEFIWNTIQNIINSDALAVAGDLLEDLKLIFSGNVNDTLEGIIALMEDLLRGPLYGITIAFDALFGTDYTSKLRKFYGEVEKTNDVFALLKKAVDNVGSATGAAWKEVDKYNKSQKTAADREKLRQTVLKTLSTIEANQANIFKALTIAQNNQSRALEELNAAQQEAAELGENSTKRLEEATKAYNEATEVVDKYEQAMVETNYQAQMWAKVNAQLSESVENIGDEIIKLPDFKKVKIDIDVSKTRQEITQCFPKKVKIPITFVSSTPGIHLSETNSQISQIIWGARGGILNGATLIGAGEAGKEALLPLDRNTEWMDMLADRIAGRGQRIQINMDGQAVYDVVVARNNAQVRRTGATELLV